MPPQIDRRCAAGCQPGVETCARDNAEAASGGDPSKVESTKNTPVVRKVNGKNPDGSSHATAASIYCFQNPTLDASSQPIIEAAGRIDIN